MALAAVAAWWWWPEPTGYAAVADDEDVAVCLDSRDVPVPDDPGDAEQEWALWSTPDALDCVVGTVGHDRLVRTLADAYASPYDDGPAVGVQRQAVSDWVHAGLDDGRPRDVVLLEAVTVVGAIWAAEDNAAAEGFAAVVVLTALREQGALPGYEQHVADAQAEGRLDADQGPDSEVALLDYDDEVLGTTSGDEQAEDVFYDLFIPVWAAVLTS